LLIRQTQKEPSQSSFFFGWFPPAKLPMFARMDRLYHQEAANAQIYPVQMGNTMMLRNNHASIVIKYAANVPFSLIFAQNAKKVKLQCLFSTLIALKRCIELDFTFFF
jgi:hypothetical protein